jgi:hypothetical protein
MVVWPGARRRAASTSPIRFESGTRTSVKNTSLNADPPFIWRNGRTSTPGAFRSTMNIVMPRCFGLSTLVRVMTAPKSEICAPVVHTFWPFRTHSSPSRTARICRLATSEPAPGSENICDQISSPCSDVAT